MKYNFIQIASAKLINDYEIVSEYDAKRLEVAKELLTRDIKRTNSGFNSDSGLFGKVFELLMRKPSSKVTWVQAQNRSDYITRINGTTTHVEVKTNFGRLGDFYNTPIETRHNKYVVYSMLVQKKEGKPKKDGTCRPSEIWSIEPVILRMDTFIDLIDSTNAMKYIEHKDSIKSDREPAIKQFYAPFYKAMKELNATPYNRLGNYKASDIK